MITCTLFVTMFKVFLILFLCGFTECYEEPDSGFDAGFGELTSRRILSESNSNSVMDFIYKVDRLDKYLESIAKRTGRKFQLIHVYHGIITTEKEESIIYRQTRRIACTGRKSILELKKGTRKCTGGRFKHDVYNWEKTCGPNVPRSSLYYKGILMHCVGSRKVDVVAGKIICDGTLYSDEELTLRCPVAGTTPVKPDSWISFEGGSNGLNQWGTLGKYNLGLVGCDSGLTVSFLQDGRRYYCMGDGVHVVTLEEGSRYKCNDRQLSRTDYLHTCGNNGNMPNDLERPTYVSIFSTEKCPGKLISVRAFEDNKLLGYCVGHTTLVTFTPPDIIYCVGGVPMTSTDVKNRCSPHIVPVESVHVKTRSAS